MYFMPRKRSTSGAMTRSAAICSALTVRPSSRATIVRMMGASQEVGKLELRIARGVAAQDGALVRRLVELLEHGDCVDILGQVGEALRDKLEAIAPGDRQLQHRRVAVILGDTSVDLGHAHIRHGQGRSYVLEENGAADYNAEQRQGNGPASRMLLAGSICQHLAGVALRSICQQADGNLVDAVGNKDS